MIGKHFGEKTFSSIWWYIRSSSDILPNWNDMRSIADITKLYEMGQIK